MKTDNVLRHVVYKTPTELILTDLEPILVQAHKERRQLGRARALQEHDRVPQEHVLVLHQLEDQVHQAQEELNKSKI